MDIKYKFLVSLSIYVSVLQQQSLSNTCLIKNNCYAFLFIFLVGKQKISYKNESLRSTFNVTFVDVK